MHLQVNGTLQRGRRRTSAEKLPSDPSEQTAQIAGAFALFMPISHGVNHKFTHQFSCVHHACLCRPSPADGAPMRGKTPPEPAVSAGDYWLQFRHKPAQLCSWRVFLPMAVGSTRLYRFRYRSGGCVKKEGLLLWKFCCNRSSTVWFSAACTP